MAGAPFGVWVLLCLVFTQAIVRKDVQDASNSLQAAHKTLQTEHVKNAVKPLHVERNKLQTEPNETLKPSNSRNRTGFGRIRQPASLLIEKSSDSQILPAREGREKGKASNGMALTLVSRRNMTKTEAQQEARRALAQETASRIIDMSHGPSICGEGGCFREQKDSEERDKKDHKPIKWRLRLHKSQDGEDIYVLTNEYGNGSDEEYDNGDIFEYNNHDFLLYIGGCCVSLIFLCFFIQLILHSTYLKWVRLQKCYLRIILLAPVYSLCAWLSIWRAQYAGYFEIVRSLYEGYVMAVFAVMILVAAGGWKNALLAMKSTARPAVLLICPCKCAKIWTFTSKEFALKFYAGLVSQFIIVKSLAASTLVILSVTLAMIGIINIYHALNHVCPNLHLGLKIGVLKGTIFFTVWQEVLFHLLISQGVIESVYCKVACPQGAQESSSCPQVCRPDVPRSGVRSVAMLVVVEMTILALLNLCVFRHSERVIQDHIEGNPAASEREEERLRIGGKKIQQEDITTHEILKRSVLMMISVLNFFNFQEHFWDIHISSIPFSQLKMSILHEVYSNG
ncbi:hypothetical protein AAMO2058_000651000 [Amorphochlora amoebiformis]